MSWGRRSRSNRYSSYGGFAPYVPVAVRRAKAAKQAKQYAAQGMALQPVQLESKKIAHTFWGKAWCENLESYSDYSNRIPRGRTYVRNGSVLHLDVRKGEIDAMVSGSSIYKIKIGIQPVHNDKWKALCKDCAGGIGSLMELLTGKLSQSVMNVMVKHGSGLFPTPAEIKLNCSCPDSAYMCKHLAAVLYGVGARLDQKPELLFLLRHVDHNELISQASAVTALTDRAGASDAATLDAADVGEVFGIEMATNAGPDIAVKPAEKKEMVKVQPVEVKKQRTTRKSVARKKAAKRKTK